MRNRSNSCHNARASDSAGSARQQPLDFMLPPEQAARRRRITELQAHWFKLIEAIADLDVLTQGKRRCVVRFIKWLLKNRKLTTWDGIATFCQTDLAKELQRDRNTIANWLKWSSEIDAIDWSIDADCNGRKRTTVQITWRRLAIRVGMNWLPPDQSETIDDQSPTVHDQSETVVDQSQTIGQHSPCPLRRTSAAPGSVNKAAAGFDDWQEVESILKSLGCRQVNSAIGYARRRGLSPSAALTDIDTYRHNETKFDRGVAALVYRWKNGEWPADGIVTAQQSAEQETMRQELREAERLQRERDDRETEEYRKQRREGRIKTLSDCLKSQR